jgi:cell division protein FtsQ
MAARRSRKRRRRGRFSFLYKLLSVVLILCAIAAACIIFFRVEDVVVVGSTVYTDQEIVDVAGVEQGDNLFLVKKIQTGKRLVSQLPYLDTVNIRRVLPSTLMITVTECVPLGVLEGEDGTWWLVDRSCKLLEQGGSELAGQYAQIRGLTALMPSAGSALAVSVEESSKLDSLKQLLSAMDEWELLEQVESIDLSGSSEVQMAYDGRFTVRLPLYSDDLHLLTHTLREVVDYLDAGQTGTIDLTGERARFIPS